MMPPPQKKDKKPLLIVVFALLSVVFMGISLIMPWYTMKQEMDFMGMSFKSESNMDFNGITTKVGDATNKTPWKDVQGSDKTKGVYSTTMIMVILGLVMSVLLLIGGVMLMKGPSKKMLALIFGLLAFIFCMLGPIMFMAQHPKAVKDDAGTVSGAGPWDSFSGARDEGGMKMSWGPGMGWIMGLMGFIFALLGFIFVLMVKKQAPAPAPPAPPAPPQA